MNTISRWLLVGVLILIGVLSFNKGLELWSLGTDVDGDGIGVYFLTFEINDNVPEENITTYAIGFFIFSILLLIISFVLLIRGFKQRHKGSSFTSGE
ncbi:hypothetical protein [Evansella tamaricis]|uniref:NADH dehydrogenase subunit 6 n=1 Tax=Evansella tamaricis TaxID=2069301 RepID=A0ABS6JPG9_9BACI|nr:hypothetical protein [Evansella tamaricis]MBU9714203.1 hypothetical protein [Evansella tamaricis]